MSGTRFYGRKEEVGGRRGNLPTNRVVGGCAEWRCGGEKGKIETWGSGESVCSVCVYADV